MAYEVSTKGDKRFSALIAKMPDGRTVEQHYQCDVKGYDPGGTDWKKGKGKPPLGNISLRESADAYVNLWRVWASHHVEEMEELAGYYVEYGGLSDMFARYDVVNQAMALRIIIEEEYLDG